MRHELVPMGEVCVGVEVLVVLGPFLRAVRDAVHDVRLLSLPANVLAKPIRLGDLPDPLPTPVRVVFRAPPTGLVGEGDPPVAVGEVELCEEVSLVHDRDAAGHVVNVEEVRPCVDPRKLIHVVIVREHKRAVGGDCKRHCKLQAHPDVVEPPVPRLKRQELVGDGQRVLRRHSQSLGPIPHLGEVWLLADGLSLRRRAAVGGEAFHLSRLLDPRQNLGLSASSVPEGRSHPPWIGAHATPPTRGASWPFHA
mmetsp:Transcript_34819/g.98723  ORF Transcript_34819/g.98723 Transcript_34819/m.98723 type:complete len:252 (+) Transcript_34819:1010-1765(+)